MSQLYKQGPNWLIVNYFSNLDFVNPIFDELYEKDWSEYTTAKGKNSNQKYILNPSWMPDDNHTVPSSWNTISTKFKEIVQRELVHYGLMPMNWKGITPKSAWTVTGEEGSYHTVHEHGSMHVCTVTYLKVPKIVNPPNGQVFFIMDSNPHNNLALPSNRVFSLQPQEGMIVIFPSWLLHGVYPQDPGTRQTINIDFKGEEIDLEYRNSTQCTFG